MDSRFRGNDIKRNGNDKESNRNDRKRNKKNRQEKGLTIDTGKISPEKFFKLW